jgi:hypothetical protein
MSKKAFETAGRAIGFVGRLIWSLFNFALTAGCLGLLLALRDMEWYFYILIPAVGIFFLVNGIRCISGRSYWMFF